jgi:hypothetical protein
MAWPLRLETTIDGKSMGGLRVLCVLPYGGIVHRIEGGYSHSTDISVGSSAQASLQSS